MASRLLKVAALAVTAVSSLAWKRRREARVRQVVLGEIHGAPVVDAMHAAKVERIAAQLRAHPGMHPVSLRKAAPPHQVPKAGDLRRHDAKIDISDLTAILHVDPIAQTCTAESGAMFCDVVAATLRYGLVPIVVPELKTITIGGAVSGCSIESMSFRHGGFHDTCVEYEVITAKGEVLTCTPDNANALVFQMVHGSFGTLGVLSKLTFKLVPAKSFVHLVYETYPTLAEYQQAIFRHYRDNDLDFMDGIIHSPTCYVLAVGHFVDTAPYTHAYDWTRVYYQSTRTRKEDYLRTPDYFFRYDRGVTNVHPKSFVGRLLFGKLADSGTVLRAAELLHRVVLDKEAPDVILDIFIPFSKVKDYLVWHERELGHYPLWCVPYRRVRDYEWLDESFYAGMEDELFLDLAIYGMKQTKDRNVHKLVEAKLKELGGVKTLISHNYYSQTEFWSIWNKRNYEEVKRVTDPDNVFRDLYTKTCRAAMGEPDDG